MSKDIRICKCGCIHFVDQDIINNAIDHDKNTLLICGQCGRATIIGADRVPNWYKESDDDPDECFDMYSYELGRGQETLILDANSFSDIGNHKPIDKVIYDRGHVVMMATGYRANYFDYNTGFEDMTYPDFIYYLNPDMTIHEIIALIDEYGEKRKTVRMYSLIHDLTDDENVLLSKARIKGIDYTGTKWELKNEIV